MTTGFGFPAGQNASELETRFFARCQKTSRIRGGRHPLLVQLVQLPADFFVSFQALHFPQPAMQTWVPGACH